MCVCVGGGGGGGGVIETKQNPMIIPEQLLFPWNSVLETLK